MSYQLITFPHRLGPASLIDLMDFNLYVVSAFFGEYVILKWNLNEPSYETLYTGVTAPGQPSAILSDDYYIYAIHSNNSPMRVYRFHKATGSGGLLGQVEIDGHSDLANIQFIKMSKKYYMVAQTGPFRRSITLFEFNGDPQDLTNSAMWAKLGNVLKDDGIGPLYCIEGIQNVASHDIYPYKHYLAIHSFSLCPPDPYPLTRTTLVLYNLVNDRLYNVRLESVDYDLNTSRDEIALNLTNPPTDNYRRDAGPPGNHFIITSDGKIYLTYFFVNVIGFTVHPGIAIGSIGNNELTYKPIGHVVYPVIETTDGKILLFAYREISEKRYLLYDPSTDTTSSIIGIGEGSGSVRNKSYCRTYEFYLPCLYLWLFGEQNAVLPPGFPYQSPGIELIDFLSVTTIDNKIHVEAGFIKEVNKARVEIRNSVTGELAKSEDFNGPLNYINKAYDIQPGKYKVVVVSKKY
ncbi:MAG: hypothetical protein QW607_09180 [Desulfurococcaceae archaeon]